MSHTSPNQEFDVFISHASEDKARFVEALDIALRQRGVTCWYDSRGIHLGDDFRRRMDEGLSQARFGVVVLSPNFFKYWPEAELSALFNQEATFNQSRIIPVRLDLDRATLTRRLPLLAPRAEVSWDLGVATVADRIRDVVRSSAPSMPLGHSRAYNLPVRRARTLYGRETDIERLLAALVAGQSVRVAASVEGLAGVGKTELALHLVDQLSQTGRFPGGIFWVDAENPNLTAVWGGPIADSLAVGAGSIEERATSALRLVSAGPPALVVLDNVERWTRESEPRPLPTGSQVSLLVTTRSRFLAGPSFEHHTLEVLVPHAARAFLTALCGRNLSHEDGVEELLKHLDGHTLALELAGAYLREFPTVSCRAYLQKLAAREDVESRVSDLVRYERTVRQALVVHQRHLDPVATRALETAACFAPEDASLALLEACGVEPDALQPLRRFHLLAGDGVRWRMHRLVREWVVDSAGPEALALARRAFVEGCVAYAGSIDLDEGFRVYHADGPHLEKAVADVRSVLGEGDDRVSHLLDRVGTALQSAGDLPGAKDLLEQALASAVKSYSTDHPAMATRRSNLALVLMDLGDLGRAKDLLEQALASDLKNFGADDPAVTTCRSNLATVLQDLGDLPRAKELMEEALASAVKTRGADHPEVATCRSNLATVLQDLGDLPRAKELMEEALASALKTRSADHPAVAMRRSNLAMVLKELGELRRANDLLEEALASELKNRGPDHPAVATGRSNLAMVLRDLGDLPRAKELLEQALASDLKARGADHPAVATRRSNLATVLRDLGDLPRAKELLETALASDLKILGTDHPDVTTDRSNLATVLRELGELPRAKELLEEALASGLKTLGADHPTVATRRSNLALVLKDLGDLRRAREMLEQALASSVKTLGADHPAIAKRRFRLAQVYAGLDDYVVARALFSQVLDAEERSLGSDHPSTAYTRASLARVLSKLGALDQARREATRALQAVSGQPHDSRHRRLVEQLVADL